MCLGKFTVIDREAETPLIDEVIKAESILLHVVVFMLLAMKY